jgi:hypothetical protein
MPEHDVFRVEPDPADCDARPNHDLARRKHQQHRLVATVELGGSVEVGGGPSADRGPGRHQRGRVQDALPDRVVERQPPVIPVVR